MIDAREELAPAAARSQNRRNAPLSEKSGRNRPTGGRVSTVKGAASSRKSLKVERVFSDPKVKPFDQIEWDKRTVRLQADILRNEVDETGLFDDQFPPLSQNLGNVSPLQSGDHDIEPLASDQR